MVSSSCKKGIFLTGSYDAFVNSKKERTQCWELPHCAGSGEGVCK
jgi:hypothetical protein